MALVGGGGKTSALRTLAEELVAAGGRVVVATTTAMFLREMAAVGPVLSASGGRTLVEQVREALAEAPVVAIAPSVRDDGKVASLPSEAVDELWAAGLADHLLVEADGSRGRSLKAFAAHEPQVPVATTVIVQVAGLDTLGRPLDDEHVHRAEALATALARPLGSEVTVGVFADAVRAQLRRLRELATEARIVTLLNKADGTEGWASGLAVAGELLSGLGDSHRRTAAAAVDRRPDRAGREIPDSIVVASLRERRFAHVPMPVGQAQPIAATDPERQQAHVAAIVLAAGRATRMGQQKLLLPLAGRPVVQWVVDAALGSSAQETVVVVGHEADRLREALAGRPVTLVENPRYGEGLSTSLQAGVRALAEGCEGAVFMLGDQPFVSSQLLERLIEGFAETGRRIVRPLVDGRPGNPVLMSAGLFPEILEQRGDVGGREIVARHGEEVWLVPVDDPTVAVDIDSSEDYEAAKEIA